MYAFGGEGEVYQVLAPTLEVARRRRERWERSLTAGE